MGEGAHLVGHSFGSPGVLFAAARRLEAARSIALLEPATFALGDDMPQRAGRSSRARGHEIQFAGGPINDVLLALWRTAR